MEEITCKASLTAIIELDPNRNYQENHCTKKTIWSNNNSENLSLDLQKISELGYFLDIFVLSLQSWDKLDWTKKHKTANSYERDNRRSFRPGREGEERERDE